MAILITQTHKWKLLQLRLRSDVRSSTYHLYPQVLHLSSPDKSVGDCSKDDQKDLEYIPKHLFLPNDLVEEVAKEEEKKPNNFEERLSR